MSTPDPYNARLWTAILSSSRAHHMQGDESRRFEKARKCAPRHCRAHLEQCSVGHFAAGIMQGAPRDTAVVKLDGYT